MLYKIFSSLWRSLKILLGVFLVSFIVLLIVGIIILKNPTSTTEQVNLKVDSYKTKWLTELNGYRIGSGLATVRENVQYSKAAQAHADYLGKTPKKYFVGKYQNLHQENPKSPFYSRLGHTIGQGDITWLYDTNESPVDSLMIAPFHAIGFLREHLKSVGYGSALVGDHGVYPGARVSNFAILQGLALKPRTKTIIFPGPNSVVRVNNFSSENPEPREACGKDFEKFVGLPIFVSLLHNPSKNLEVKLTWRNGKELTQGSQLCVVTENNFRTTDPIYGPAGKAIIAQENLVIIMSKSALSEGTYKVEVIEPHRAPIAWKFSYKAS